MKCLILGGGGFLGSHLSEALVAQGYSVRIFDRPNISHFSSPVAHRIEWFEGDFLNPRDVSIAMEHCDIVFHLISMTLPQSSNLNPTYDLEANVVSTLQLLGISQKHNIKKIIFVSSGGTVYGVPKSVPISESHPTEPTCAYGISKLAIEKYLALYHQLHGLDYCVLRLANPFGQRQRVNAAQGAVTVFLIKALQDEVIEIWGDGSIVRDYFYVSDAVSALIEGIDYNGDNRVFNIGSGVGRSLNEVLDAIDMLMGKSVARNYLPSRGFDVPANVLDITLAQQQLDWSPQTSFEDGLLKTYQWLKSGQ